MIFTNTKLLILVITLVLSFLYLPFNVLAASSNYIIKVDTAEKKVALTFDDGSDGSNIYSILNILDNHNIKATFFLTGSGAEDHPQAIIDIVNAGHDIGNHSYNHPSFPSLSNSQMQSQLATTEEIIVDLTGVSTKPYFRAPFGETNANVLSVVGNAGYTYTFHWTIDSADWTGNSAWSIQNRILNNIVPGAIVLMHTGAGASGTPTALETIIPSLKNQGYQFVTLSQLLNSSGNQSPEPDNGSATTYVVKAGDTLYRIATSHNTSVAQIASANNISNVNLLRIGQVLTIPSSSTIPPPTPEPEPEPEPEPTPSTTYTVKAGDTLYKIAQQFDTSVSAIASLNQLANPNLLRIGQVLKISGTTSPIPDPDPDPEPVPEPEPEPTPTTTYTVKAGDTLYKIAQQFNTSVSTLTSLNQLANPNLLRIGQVLKITGTTNPIPVPDPEPTPTTTYTVKAGDTLYSIATRYGTSVSALVSLNNLSNPNLLRIGQVLKIE